MSEASIHVMFFCLGNICRSPLAEALFIHKLESRGLDDRFVVESSGTGAYHVGEQPDPGSQRVARERLGLDISHQRAQQLEPVHLDEFDYLVAMDPTNKRRALALTDGDADHVLLLRDFEPDPAQRGHGVPDPWGGGPGGFDEVFEIVDRCLDHFLDWLVDRHALA